jgi:hypothetical protein
VKVIQGITIAQLHFILQEEKNDENNRTENQKGYESDGDGQRGIGQPQHIWRWSDQRS